MYRSVPLPCRRHWAGGSGGGVLVGKTAAEITLRAGVGMAVGVGVATISVAVGAVLTAAVGATTGKADCGVGAGVAAAVHPINPAASSSRMIRQSGLKQIGNIGG